MRSADEGGKMLQTFEIYEAVSEYIRSDDDMGCSMFEEVRSIFVSDTAADLESVRISIQCVNGFADIVMIIWGTGRIEQNDMSAPQTVIFIKSGVVKGGIPLKRYGDSRVDGRQKSLGERG